MVFSIEDHKRKKNLEFQDTELKILNYLKDIEL